MKGTTFQKPLEFQIQIEGEAWHQSDAIQGVLKIKNHGPESVQGSGLKVMLGHGRLSNIRKKDPDAFEISGESSADGVTVPPGGEHSLSWKFQLERNAPITDSVSSLFMIYGQGDATEKMGQLQLAVKPFWVIEEVLKVFQITNRFPIKSLKASKGKIAALLSPPSSQAFATLEELKLMIWFEEETLKIDYAFAVKKVEATAASFDVKKSKRDTEQSFEKSEYLIPSGRFNHEVLEKAVSEALSMVEKKVLF